MFLWMNIAAEHNVHKAQEQYHNTDTVLLAALFTQLLELFLAYFIVECFSRRRLRLNQNPTYDENTVFPIRY